MAENYFELVGRVGWIECKFTEKATCIVNFTLGQNTGKKDKDEKPIYNNYFIKFINSADAKNKIAENFADQIKKGDYVRVKGILVIDKFRPENSQKEVERLALMGRIFSKVRFDEFEKKYVDVNS